MARWQAVERARRLRHGQTQAEAALWRVLRNRRLDGFKFRRQVVIDRYIVDFACPDKKLVVEVDGSQHGESASDAVRDRALADLGWTVLRFWNDDVLRDIADVCQHIVNAAGLGGPERSDLDDLRNRLILENHP